MLVPEEETNQGKEEGISFTRIASVDSSLFILLFEEEEKQERKKKKEEAVQDHSGEIFLLTSFVKQVLFLSIEHQWHYNAALVCLSDVKGTGALLGGR